MEARFFYISFIGLFCDRRYNTSWYENGSSTTTTAAHHESGRSSLRCLAPGCQGRNEATHCVRFFPPSPVINSHPLLLGESSGTHASKGTVRLTASCSSPPPRRLWVDGGVLRDIL